MEYEPALAIFIRGLASELRMYDQDILVKMIRNRDYAGLDDLLGSSIELYFDSEIVLFCWSATARSGWADESFILVNLELRCGHTSIFFSLRLSAKCASVSIIHIAQDDNLQALERNDLESYLARYYTPSRGVTP